MKLEGRTAIVTGARRGIGRAVALALAREGANVAVSDISQEDCQKVVGEIEKLGRKGLAVRCDVTSTAEVEDLVKNTVAEFGKLDISLATPDYASGQNTGGTGVGWCAQPRTADRQGGGGCRRTGSLCLLPPTDLPED